MELLNSSVQEKEEMTLKQDELINEVNLRRKELKELKERLVDIYHLQENIKELTAKRDGQDAAIAELQEAAAKDQIEITKLRLQLDHEKAKVKLYSLCICFSIFLQLIKL